MVEEWECDFVKNFGGEDEGGESHAVLDWVEVREDQAEKFDGEKERRATNWGGERR